MCPYVGDSDESCPPQQSGLLVMCPQAESDTSAGSRRSRHAPCISQRDIACRAHVTAPFYIAFRYRVQLFLLDKNGPCQHKYRNFYPRQRR